MPATKPTVSNVKVKKKGQNDDVPIPEYVDVIITGADFPANPSVTLLNLTPAPGSGEPTQPSSVALSGIESNSTQIVGQASLNGTLLVKTFAYTLNVEINNDTSSSVNAEVEM